MHQAKTLTQKKRVHHPKKKIDAQLIWDNKFWWFLLPAIFVTLIIYIPAMSGEFVWDDVNYVQNNSIIHSLDLSQIFSKYVMGNYHPLTIFVYAIEYKLWGLSPAGYHIVNLLIHFANIVLVFYAIFLLTKKPVIGFVACCLFAIHPMHVESVAWISELKDLLYTFFFLGSFICYMIFIKQNKKQFYFFSLGLFLLSLLSKGMAVSLPLVLLLTDFFVGRKFNLKTIVEKIPFFILAIIFGVIAIYAQRSSEAIQNITFYSIPQRVVFASYGFITYLWKFILPLDQSAFYPYPIKGGENLGGQFYIYPLLALALIAFLFYSLRSSKKIFFGIAFFIATVFLVLQLLPVGNAVMADRYSYVPSIGIFYLAAEGFYWMWNKSQKTFAIGLIGLFALFFSATTFLRNRVWENGISLWTDVIEKFPNSEVGYNNRGGTYLNDKKPDEALPDLNKAIQLLPNYAEALSNRGIILSNKKMNNEALRDLNKAIETRPNYPDAINNRGVVLMDMNRLPEALNDFNKAIELKPDYADAYYNRGVLFMNQNKKDEAIKDFNTALQLNPNYAQAKTNIAQLQANTVSPDQALDDYKKKIGQNPKDTNSYYGRAILLMNLNRLDEALPDLNKVIELSPNYADAYNARAVVFMGQKKYDEALKDCNKAIELNKDLAEAYLNRGTILREQNNNSGSITDFNKAIELDSLFAKAYYGRGVAFMKLKKLDEAILDFSRSLELRSDSAMCFYSRGIAEMMQSKKDAACQDLQMAVGLGVQAAIQTRKNLCGE